MTVDGNKFSRPPQSTVTEQYTNVSRYTIAVPTCSFAAF